MLRKYGKDPGEMSVLDRLAIVGSSGMGALTFEPEKYFPAESGRDRLDELALECRKILNTEYSDNWTSCTILEEPAAEQDQRF